MEDHLLQSTNELRKMLSDLQAKWLAADGSLQVFLEALPKRERLVLRHQIKWRWRLLLRHAYSLLAHLHLLSITCQS